MVLFSALIIIFILLFNLSTQNVYGYESSILPVTYRILETIALGAKSFVFVLLIIYTENTIVREKDCNTNEIIDSLPTPSWVFVLSKILTLLILIFCLLSLFLVTGLAVQVINGYYNFELGLYFRSFYIYEFLDFFNFLALAFFLYVLFEKRYARILITSYLFGQPLLSHLIPNKLLMFNASPRLIYSDMNGYGHLLNHYLIFKIYWLLFSLTLLFSTLFFFRRGKIFSIKDRIYLLKQRLNRRLLVFLSLAFLSFLSIGSFIYYNTKFINSYNGAKKQTDLRYLYESKYKKDYENKDHLEIVSIKAHVDLFPNKRTIQANVSYQLKNKTESPIDTLFIDIGHKWGFELSSEKKIHLVEQDKDLGVFIYKFEEPINPQSTVSINYKIDHRHHGIINSILSLRDLQLVKNGTFITNSPHLYFPRIGYQSGKEISSDQKRKKYKLSPKEYAKKIDDEKGQRYSFASQQAKWIDFEIILSTDKSQIALAPGNLIRSWKKKNRNYFHYKTNQPILDFYSIASGRYALRKETWNGVEVEIYYHPLHKKNIDRILKATKTSLNYFTENFSPYKYKKLKIIEYPRYRNHAQSFPGTIFISEELGFIHKFDSKNENSFDFLTYVVAHEIAHQWWGHQVVPANVQGAHFLLESFAQYSALMVIKELYGLKPIKYFLNHNLNEYLTGRNRERKKETPLVLVDGSHVYIFYNKGILTMYALKNKIGEKKLNAILKEFIKSYTQTQLFFPRSLDFINLLKRNTHPKDHSFIVDLFENIVLYDNRLIEISCEDLLENYLISFYILGKKFYTDKIGKEIEKPFETDVLVEILNEEGKTINAKKYTLKNEKQLTSIKIKKNQDPGKVVLDSFNTFIDKNAKNNVLNIRNCKTD